MPHDPFAIAPRRPRRLRRVVLSVLAALAIVIGGLTAAFGVGFTQESAAYAAAGHTVTFVNASAEKVWVGSTVNADRRAPAAMDLQRLREPEVAPRLRPGRQTSQGGACRPLEGRPQRATPSS